MNGHEHFPHAHHDTSENTTFGFWVYLMTDSILFATLFATYAVLQNNTFGGPTASELFSRSLALTETITLLLSSFTCGVAMTALSENNVRKLIAWYGATFLLGMAFLGMVGSEFSHLIETGNSWQRNAFLTSYFTLVGTHALHIVFGLFFMVLFVGQTLCWGIIPMTIRRLNCLKLFWFFSYFIWIFMFVIVYLIGVQK